MSERTILRGARLELQADRAPGAPEATYVAECLACRAESGLAHSERRPVAVWSLEHTRHHGPAHSDFVVTTQSHWRVGPVLRSRSPGWPGSPGPAAAPASRSTPPPPPPPHPPRPPRVSARHARRRVRSLAESLLLMALLVGSVSLGVGVSLGI